MGVMAVSRWSALLLLCMSQFVTSLNGFKIPDVFIQALKPKGLRVIMQDVPKISRFIFQGRVNREIREMDIGEISAEVTETIEGMWIFEDQDIDLKYHDVINYYIFVTHDHRGYLKDGLKFTVTAFVDAFEPLPKTVLPRSPDCLPTLTKLRVGTACGGKIVFEDNFNVLSEDLWQIEQYVPDHPEYPFVSYQRPPNAQTVTVNNGYLRIEPQLQQEQPDFNNESIYSSTLNLFSGYMHKNSRFMPYDRIRCYHITARRKRSDNKQNFAFTYGTVEVRAKLPQGDWLYPEILLESLLKKYGTLNYASGVIRIAGALGNRELNLGPVEYGNKVLYGGAIMDLACKDLLIGRKELYNKRFWGDSFHIFKMYWTPEKLTFEVDNEEWLNITPAGAALQGRFNNHCRIPRTLLSMGTRMAPFDDHFYLTLGVAAGGITEFQDNVVSRNGLSKPWGNRSRKASFNFWKNLPLWRSTWSQPALVIDYVKVRAL